MTASRFNDLTDVYEAMIDWPKRLANEEPFYRGLFEALEAKSVLDAACGTGRHAAAFHSWGLRVEAADLSPAMIQRAKESVGEPPGLRWVVRGFDQPAADGGPFDAAVCVGNSLALAPNVATAEQAVGRMLEAVRPGGAVVLHVLNLWRLPEGPCLWQKCRRSRLPEGEALIVKGVSRCGGRGFVHLVVATLDARPELRTESVPFLGLEAAELEQFARRAGARTVQCFGDYQRRPYDRLQGVDLILLAER